MIRKAVIVVLTLGAVGTLVGWVVTIRRSVVYNRGLFQVGVVEGNFSVQDWSTSVPPNVVMNLSQGWYVSRSSSFYWMPAIYYRNGSLAGVRIPLWMLFLLLATYPTLAFIRGPLRRWRRRKRGECVNCGYNLTGNVTDVCSECGVSM